MPLFRPNIAPAMHSRFNQGHKHGSRFNALMTELKPFAWWKLNDVPASGTVLDYGNINGSATPPIAPPHNLTLPAHLSSVPGMTTDGANGLGWDGTDGAQMDFGVSALDNLPQGLNWSILFINKSNPGNGQQTLFDFCGGLGTDNDGKAHFIAYTGVGGGGNQLQIQSFYQSGTNVTANYNGINFNDGAWHMYVLNIYGSVPNTPAAVMNYDLYIDGAFSATAQLNSNGLSTWYGGANDASIPDGFHLGGYSPNVGNVPRTKGAMQHVALFIGGALTQFGGMLTAAQIQALYNGR